MALLNWLRRNTGPNPDPEPGEGGYTGARGPMGEGGYPGSTGQRRSNPAEAGGKLRDAHGGRLAGYGTEPDARRRSAIVEGSYSPASDPAPRTRRGTGREWPPTEEQGFELQAEATEWFGGPNRRIGTSERGPGDTPGKASATQRQRTLGFEGTRGLAAGIPGNANQRNTKFYAGRKAAPDGGNRYVFGGTNGGQTSYTFTRRMPYTSRGDGARGACLTADRYYAANEGSDYFADQGGQYGYMRGAPDGRHRPTEYYEPGPWTANFYDTTASAGSPGEAGSGGQAYQAVTYSPRVGGRRRA